MTEVDDRTGKVRDLPSHLSSSDVDEWLHLIQRDLVLPADYGVLLIGSIAEGFGNTTSDIDLLILLDDREERPTGKTMMRWGVDGSRRVEVLFRSNEDLELLAKSVRSGAANREDNPRYILDFYQRITRGVALWNAAFCERARQGFDEKVAARQVSAWAREKATWNSIATSFESAIGGDIASAPWATETTFFAAVAWAAEANESYVGDKWLLEKLIRLEVEEAVLNRVQSLLCDDGAPHPLHMNSCLALMEYFQFERPAFDFASVSLAVASELSEHEIDGRLYLYRGDTIWALNDDVGSVWKEISGGTSVGVLLATAKDERRLRKILFDLHRSGLVIAHLGESWSWVRGNELTPVAMRFGALTARGYVSASHDWVIEQIPLPLRRFVASSMDLLYSALYLGILQEDVMGSYEARQRGALALQIKYMARKAADVLLSAHGINPLPPKHESISRMMELTTVPDESRSAILACASKAVIDDVDAAEAYASANALPSALPDFLAVQQVVDINKSAEGMQFAFTLGVPWIQLAQELGVPSQFAQEEDEVEAARRGEAVSRLTPEAVVRHLVGWKTTLPRASSGNTNR